MCGRMVLTRTAHELGEIFDAEPDAPDCELGPRYNVAPSQDVLALRGGSGGGRALARLHWGLIPSWARERAVGYRMINARSETAAEKPSFRKALRARRCIVPADGFYEWQSPSEEDPRFGNRPKRKPTKIPHFFRNPAGRTLAIAGLWESWTDTGTGEVVESCTLLTTEANDDVRPVHHRMPVFLDAKDYAVWLDPDLSDIEPLQALMVPAPDGLLEATRVSVWVNNPRNEDARCIEAAP